MICKRHDKDNNPHLANLDPDRQRSYIGEWDTNTLYEYALFQFLRMTQFYCVGKEDWERTNLQGLGDEKRGQIISSVPIAPFVQLSSICSSFPFHIRIAVSSVSL